MFFHHRYLKNKTEGISSNFGSRMQRMSLQFYREAARALHANRKATRIKRLTEVLDMPELTHLPVTVASCPVSMNEIKQRSKFTSLTSAPAA
jgi:hypothetical protein